MKNLITLATIATFSLAACQKTQYNDDAVTVGISGYLTDSSGSPRTNKTYNVFTGELHPATAFNPPATVTPDSNGYFYTSLLIRKEGDQVNFIEQNSHQGTYMHIAAPVAAHIDAGTLKVGDTRYMQ